MADEPIVINPSAILKSIEETYNYLIATGVSDPAQYEGLQAQIDRWVNRWLDENLSNPTHDAARKQEVEFFVQRGQNLSQRLGESVKNAGLVQYSRARDNMIASQSIDRAKLDEELRSRIRDGMSVEEAINFMSATGQYDAHEMQFVASQAGQRAQDGLSNFDTGTGDGFFGPSGGGSFKPYEKIAADYTDPKTEFEKAFSQFSRGLMTSQHGAAPEVGALAARYQDLFQQYLGEIEKRKTAGEEPANVWKEAFVNIGKSTDPQYDQTSDRQQAVTVRPKLSAYDWLLANVQPKDVYASTPFNERPGRSTGGFRGYIRRAVG